VLVNHIKSKFVDPKHEERDTGRLWRLRAAPLVQNVCRRGQTLSAVAEAAQVAAGSVVASSAHGTAHEAEHFEDQADHHEDDSDGPQDPDPEH
jgi:hypothetical protein